jgi:hypothetical protein
MRVRFLIAALTGGVIGLVTLAWIQARQLRELRREWLAAASATQEIPSSTNQRPLRLRLQSLPPINIRTEVRDLDWRSVESENYETYIANLRRIGCPEETIRDIIVADIEKLYATRRRALDAPQPDWNFWRHPDELPEDDAESQAARAHETQLAALRREQRQLLVTLLGESAIRAELDDYAAEALGDRNLRFLPPDKRQAVAQATAQWRLAREAAFLAADDAEITRLIRQADATLDETVGRVLSPEEREAYEMRSSPLADDLRERLRGFGASREEFEQLYRLENSFDQEQRRLQAAAETGSDPQAIDKQEAAAIEHEARIRETLGEARYADFLRANDPDFQTLFSLARDHAMPTDLANQVWGMRREVENQTQRIRQNPFLTADQKVRALEAIRSETQAAIVDVLGEPLLQDYQREGGGWLVDLTDATDLGETGRAMVPPPLPGILPEGQPGLPVLPQP